MAMASGPAASAAPPVWAPAGSATIHPGVAITASERCTANFVFYDATDVYIGTAAHCADALSDPGDAYCGGLSLPYGTPVEVQGARRPATLVYSSWREMN